MTTMDAIRAQYPTPTIPSRLSPDSDAYCLGAAVCRVAFPALPSYFPTAKTIALALAHLNPALSPGAALDAAYTMLDANDREDYDGGWQIVQAALTA
jgi:hypothetical protein